MAGSNGVILAADPATGMLREWEVDVSDIDLLAHFSAPPGTSST
ncbi:hypothetical protein [Microbacterium sp. 77mftsu3.1]|nr:hypothetical protein [Microbacterium sp. 77mftsu3.1]